MRPARQRCSVLHRDARGPGARGLDLCSCQSSSCLPLTACSPPARVARGQSQGPTLHNSRLACLAFPMPADCPSTSPIPCSWLGSRDWRYISLGGGEGRKRFSKAYTLFFLPTANWEA